MQPPLTIVISLTLLTLGSTTPVAVAVSMPDRVVSMIKASVEDFPATSAQAEEYKVTNANWKSDVLKYLANCAHNTSRWSSAAGVTGHCNIRMNNFVSTGEVDIASTTAVRKQGSVTFETHIPLRNIQIIRLSRPKYSRTLVIELVTQNAGAAIGIKRTIMPNGVGRQPLDSYKSVTNRVAFSVPLLLNEALTLVNLVSDVVRQTGSNVVIDIPVVD